MVLLMKCCRTTRVAQQPLEAVKRPSGDANDPKVAILGAEAEESRPALPVAGLRSSFNLARIKNAAAGVRQEPGGEQVDEVEGEIITDESGLLMRTPRRSTVRGLYFAAKTGDLQLVRRLLGISNDEEATAAATDEDSTDVPNTSRSCGRSTPASPTPADLNERGMWDNTPLLVAAQYGQSDIALALLKHGADARAENERRATALHYSSAEGHVELSQALLDNGADIDPPAAAVHHSFLNGGRSQLLTPLSAAAVGGHTELVRLLLERGAEVDRRVFPETPRNQMSSDSLCESSRRTSALMEAARYGHTDTCALLIDKGARLLAQDSDGRTALMHAIYGGHERTANVLLLAAEATGRGRCLSETGEQSTKEGHPGLKPLQLACDKDLHVVVEALLSAGIDVDARDPSGATTLTRTCRKGSAWCVGKLLANGADPLAADKYGDTPILAARKRDSHRANGEAILKLVEAAVAAREAKEPLSADPEREMEQGAANGDGEHYVKGNPNETRSKEDDGEDVLLVSDWNSNEDLERFDIWDGDSVPIKNSNTRLEDVDSAAVAAKMNSSEDDRENGALILGDCEDGNPPEMMSKDETGDEGKAHFREAKGGVINKETEPDRAKENVLSARNSKAEIAEGGETSVEASLLPTSVKGATEEDRDKGRSPLPENGDEIDFQGPDQVLPLGKAVEQERLSSISSPGSTEERDARDAGVRVPAGIMKIDSVTVEAPSWRGSSASASAFAESGCLQLDEGRSPEPEGSTMVADDSR